MFLPDLVIRSRQVVTPRGLRPASVHVRNGKVIGVVDFDDVPAGCPLEDAGDLAMLPGIVDTQVCVCPPNLPNLDGFEAALETGTRAAAVGGVTTIVDTPDGALATATVSSFGMKRQAAAGRSFVDVGFWGSAVPGNAGDLAPLFEAGVLGFACDLEQSRAAGCHAVSEADLRVAMPVLTRLGATLVAGAGLARPTAGPHDVRSASGPGRRWFKRLPWLPHPSRACQYATYLESRPKAAENEAVDLLIRLCRASATRTHIATLSSSDVLTPLYRARAERLPITAGTCPHYLYFVAEEVPDDATAFLCDPPIRDRANRELLWAALANGLIQMVASGRGISSLELNLSVMWTVARARGRTLEHLAEWMCRRPAELAGLTRKGKIDVGYDADLVVFNPDREFVVEARSLQRSARPSPYLGRRLRGTVEGTYLRGTRIYRRRTDSARQEESIEASPWRGPLEARGRLLVRGAT
ncbi:MAG TPA: amidohydrolase family protein [Vicinamibacterales bacterium]|nr:amidohydrolase family protein [Vicinamibacterales bacterium]